MPSPFRQPGDGADPALETLARELRRGRLRGPAVVASILLGAAVVAASTCRPVELDAVEREGGFRFQDGDLIFVSCRARLCRVIEGVTESPFSHVAMVSGSGESAKVIEAYGPVGEVSLQEFLERCDGKFTLMRWQGELAKRVADIEEAMKEFYGRPYDARYRWDDEAIYCTELVYKAVERATKIRLAPLRRLDELHYQPYQDFIVQLEGSLPLDREMITPADLQRSAYLRLVYSTIDLD